MKLEKRGLYVISRLKKYLLRYDRQNKYQENRLINLTYKNATNTHMVNKYMANGNK